MGIVSTLLWHFSLFLFLETRGLILHSLARRGPQVGGRGGGGVKRAYLELGFKKTIHMQPKSAYAPNRHKYTVDARAAERVKRAHAPTHALYHARSIMACTVFHVESIELHLMTNARLNCIHARKILVNTQMQTRTSCMRVSTCAAHVYTELAIPVHILGHNAGTHATFCVRVCVRVWI